MDAQRDLPPKKLVCSFWLSWLCFNSLLDLDVMVIFGGMRGEVEASLTLG